MTAEEFNNKIIPFSGKLYPMIFRILGDEEETRDALQDLMIKLWKRRKELDQCSNLSAYIITMTKNHSLDLLKKKRPVRLGETETYKLNNLEGNEIHHETREKFKHVHEIIGKLPDKYRKVIRMRDIDGFTFEEMKELTGFEIPYLRVILSRARMKVKEELVKIYDYDTTEGVTRKVLQG